MAVVIDGDGTITGVTGLGGGGGFGGTGTPVAIYTTVPNATAPAVQEWYIYQFDIDEEGALYGTGDAGYVDYDIEVVPLFKVGAEGALVWEVDFGNHVSGGTLAGGILRYHRGSLYVTTYNSTTDSHGVLRVDATDGTVLGFIQLTGGPCAALFAIGELLYLHTSTADYSGSQIAVLNLDLTAHAPVTLITTTGGTIPALQQARVIVDPDTDIVYCAIEVQDTTQYTYVERVDIVAGVVELTPVWSIDWDASGFPGGAGYITGTMDGLIARWQEMGFWYMSRWSFTGELVKFVTFPNNATGPDSADQTLSPEQDRPTARGVNFRANPSPSFHYRYLSCDRDFKFGTYLETKAFSDAGLTTEWNMYTDGMATFGDETIVVLEPADTADNYLDVIYRIPTKGKAGEALVAATRADVWTRTTRSEVIYDYAEPDVISPIVAGPHGFTTVAGTVTMAPATAPTRNATPLFPVAIVLL
jgi:hypothetical protein